MDVGVREEFLALLPRMRRLCHGLARGAEDGDDLLQTVCEKVVSRAHQHDRGKRLDQWVYRIVYTTWFDTLRARKVRARYHVGGEPDLLPGVHGVEAAEAAVTLGVVERAIAKLPDEQRAVLLLVGVEGLTYKEAASILDTPIGTVMSRLARGRIALGRMLEGRVKDQVEDHDRIEASDATD
jgi:RNA polymerase sigma-70 factor (ECF subfamily)